MKKLLFLFCAIFIMSCNDGLNKSILDTLTVDELKSNMTKDSTFSDFYKEIQEIRSWILSSDVNQAEWGGITYKRVKKYNDRILDTVWLNELGRVYKQEYELLYPDYQVQVDSIMTFWRNYQEKYKLESYVEIEFYDLWKEYYDYSGDVKNVNIGFKVTPLQGTIEQLIFRYDIKSKISNDGTIGYLDGKRCLASSPIYSSKTLYWEADYSDEKYLKNMTKSQVERDYDFNIEIVEVRIDGENIKDKIEAIPHSVYMALKYCSEGNNYYADDIIKEFINKDYQSYWEYCNPKYFEEAKKIDPDVYSMYDKYNKYKKEER